MTTHTYHPHEVSVQMEEILKHADELQSGCFIFIRGYHASNGEVANYWLQYGRDYVRIKENLIEKIKAILWKHELFSINVDYWTWLDDKGEHAVHAKDRKEVHVELKRLTTLDDDLRQSLRELLRNYGVRQAREVKNGVSVRPYDKLAKGIYIDRDNVIHFRMSTLAHKEVLVPPAKKAYSIRKSAIKQALKDKFLKLKAFKLGQFESMSIGGQQLLGEFVPDQVPVMERVEP